MAQTVGEAKLEEQNESIDILAGIDTQNIELVDLIERPAWKSILIELVKSEKMDPWNIDLIELAEKYLKKINALQGKDLRIPANAILASAILLRFKARALKISSVDDEEEMFLEKKELTPEQRKELEEMLPELRVIKSTRQGKVSLDELVNAIEKMLDKNKDRFEKRALGTKEVIEFKLPYADYNIDERIEQVFGEIKSKADSTGMLLFSHLVEGKKPAEIIDTFVPCLFLANKQKINIWQEEFFGEIFISLAN